MKTLVLIRHGKSSWEHNLRDHDRPLIERAEKDIKLIAEHTSHWLDEKFTFYSSSARRANDTANLYLKHRNLKNTRLSVSPQLYTFDPQKLKRFVHKLDNNIEKIVLFGHNPAFTDLANQLGDAHFDNVPTAGLVKLTFESGSWLQCKTAKTELYLFPKNLRDGTN